MASDPDSQALASSRRWLEPRPTMLPAPTSSSELAFAELLEEIASHESTFDQARPDSAPRYLSPPPPPSSRRTIPGLHETIIAPADRETSEKIEQTQPFDRRLLAGTAFLSEPSLPTSPRSSGSVPGPTSLSPITLDGATEVLSSRPAQHTVRIPAAVAARPSRLVPGLLSALATVVGVAAVVLVSLESPTHDLAPSRVAAGAVILRPKVLVLGTPAQDVAAFVASTPPPKKAKRRLPPPPPVVVAPAPAASDVEPVSPPEDAASEPPPAS